RAITIDKDIRAGVLWFAQALQTTGSRSEAARISARSLIGAWSQSLPTNFLVHDAEVVAVSFSPDGQTIATGSSANTARLWDVQTGQPCSEPLKHKRAIQAICFSPDGRMLATASKDDTVRLWDAKTGQPRGKPLQHDATVESVSFNSDGSRLATQTEDHEAWL